MASNRHVVYIVSVFNRQTKKLPCDRRQYRLDWSRANLREREEVIALLDAREPRVLRRSPNELGEQTTVWSHNAQRPKSPFLLYRHLFVPYEGGIPDDADAFFMGVDPGYFEDETGQPLSELELLSCVSGQKQPLVVGKVESVLAFGPAPMLLDSEWNSEVANHIAHFLFVIEELASSRWLKAPVEISDFRTKEGDTVDSHGLFPNRDDTRSVIAYVRQLYSPGPGGLDDLLAKVCVLYGKHCGDTRKVWWVNERHATCLETWNQPPAHSKVIGFTVEELVKAVIYGAGIMHVPTPREKPNYERLCSTTPLRDIYMAFHSSLRRLFALASSVYHPVHQDFEHWVKTLGHTGPTAIRF